MIASHPFPQPGGPNLASSRFQAGPSGRFQPGAPAAPFTAPDPVLPPHSIEMEAGLLACCLLDPAGNIPKCAARLEGPDVFYDLRHRTLFESLRAMFERKVPIDLVSVYQYVKDHRLDAELELAFLHSLTDSIPSAASFEYYLEQTLDFHYRRKAIQELAGAQARILDPDAPAGSCLLEGGRNLIRLGELAASGPKPRVLTHRHPEEILSLELPEDDCLLGDRLLAKGQSMTLLGAGGIGKSRLLLQLAISAIIGRDFLGLPTCCPGSRWLIVQTENSNRRLQMDLAALRQWAGPAWEQVNHCLALHTLENEEDGQVNLDIPEQAAPLRELIARFKPSVICFDPLKDFTCGDLNRDMDMAQLCQRMSRLAKFDDPTRALLVLHHSLTGKAGISRVVGWDRSSFGRNSKMLQAWTRAQINVAPARPDNNQELILSCGKCSNGPEFEPFAIRLNPSTMIYERNPDFDFDWWEREMAGQTTTQPSSISTQQVAALCPQPLSRAALVEAIIATHGLSKSAAYRRVEAALRSGHLIYHAASRQYQRNLTA